MIGVNGAHSWAIATALALFFTTLLPIIEWFNTFQVSKTFITSVVVAFAVHLLFTLLMWGIEVSDTRLVAYDIGMRIS